MSEIWKPIAGFPGYEVSDIGRVRSPRKVLAVRVNANRGGYRYVEVGQKPIRATRRVCGLVAEAFVGSRCGQVVRHKNGDAADDRAANLEYGTQGDNNRDAVRHGTFVSAKRLAHLRRIAPLGGAAAHA